MTPSSFTTDPTTEFDELLKRYGDMAYRMAYQLTGGRESEARDLVQDGFLKIWRQWEKERPVSIRPWMYRLLRNLYIDSIRKSARRRAISLDQENGSGESLHEELAARELSVEAQAEQKELEKEVASALSQLDPEYRLPVVLCDMEYLSYEEIARALDCPVGTVRSRIHRGRLQLRRLLARWWAPPLAAAGALLIGFLWRAHTTASRPIALETLVAEHRRYEFGAPLAKQEMLAWRQAQDAAFKETER